MAITTLLQKDRWLMLALLLLSVPLFFLNVHHTHSAGGDDYALYIQEARNIAEGRPFYQTSYVFNEFNNCYSPPHYPPGYPLLLAPVVAVWGIDIYPLCVFNTVVAVLLMLAFFVYLRQHMAPLAAACIAVLISYAGVMIGIKQAIVADTTCLLFVMGYLIVRQRPRHTFGSAVLLALLGAMATLTRTQAVLLLLAEPIIWVADLLYQRWGKERTQQKAVQMLPLVAAGGGFVLLWLLGKTVFHSPDSASGFYVSFLKDTLAKGVVTIVRDNVNFFIATVKSFFHYDTDNSIRTAMVTMMESAGLVLTATGFAVSVRQRITYADVFFVLMCGLMLYYPIHDERYFLPAIPLVYLYCYRALRLVIPAVTTLRLRYAGLAITLFCLVAGMKYLRDTTQPPVNYVPENRDWQAFTYLRQHVPDSALVVCARPRLLSLYTGRRSVIHAWQHPMERNKEIFDQMQAQYLLVAWGVVEDYYHQYLNGYQHPVDSTVIAPGYTLYRLR
jgi:hypothetical protein